MVGDADTIRAVLEGTLDDPRGEALAALDALLAERQQLREALQLIISEHGLINPKVVAEAALARVEKTE